MSCYYRATSGTPVNLLDPFGSFTTGMFAARGFNGDAVHKVADHPALADLTDAYLSNWGQSTRNVFETFTTNFLPLFIALDAPDPGIVSFPDGTSGVSYILARGADLVPVLCDDGNVDVGEECDDGNTINGDRCSAQCLPKRTLCLCSGDPNFKTWLGHSFDCHGECDLVVLQSATFELVLRLDIHIRTQTPT
jgi:cysteine-rich repeat protein